MNEGISKDGEARGTYVINMHDGHHEFAVHVDLQAVARALCIRARRTKTRRATAVTP